jgi:hypothetical protein
MLKYPVIEESRALSVSSPICFTRIPPAQCGFNSIRSGLTQKTGVVFKITNDFKELMDLRHF